MARKKVSVIGAGHVGAHTALWVARKEVADVVLVDILEGMPAGKALDMMEAAPVEGFDANITGSNDYSAIEGSDIVVITAGLARKPGMSRSDLVGKNTAILKSVIDEVVKYAPDAILIIVTNPLDIMVHIAWKLSGFPAERVIGMAGALDSARLKAFMGMALGVSVENISAMVIGGHADSMVPLKRYSTVGGIPLPQLLPDDKIDALMQRTKTAGGEIVALLKTGSAYFAPSAAAAEMVEAILKDKKKVMPCAVYCDGKYGLDGVYVGLPVKLGAAGVEGIIEIELDQGEQAAFDSSVAAIRELVGELKI
ncbi:Malate dehydrogenase [hydrothermal vent metagenome]|uniref:Malate dehydrogenase n=1 Tax=hydrothermal vent metagenome TaxID=652676 RepID=A0A3B0VCG7_9ZZZZ